MSDSSGSVKATGPSMAGLLFLVFLVLKLTHKIDWSWWWVTAPLWIEAALAVLVGCALLVIFWSFHD